MYRSIKSAVVFCGALLVATVVQGDPIRHTITFSADSFFGTPFGLTSPPSPITGEFSVDDSIFAPGAPEVIDALPGFSLIAPLVMGDATFTNADIAVVPGGRVVGGKLVEIFFLAQFVDPLKASVGWKHSFSLLYNGNEQTSTQSPQASLFLAPTPSQSLGTRLCPSRSPYRYLA
jgi:hypothetical protein